MGGRSTRRPTYMGCRVWRDADYGVVAPKKKQEKMALGDFLANQCTHDPSTADIGI